MTNRANTISKRFRVKPGREIKVTNVVGQEQPGSWSMSLDNQRLASGTDKQTVTVGSGDDLVYRELRIAFVIHDYQWQHDRLSATSVITDGVDTLEVTHDQPGEAGDSATYITLIQFV